MSTRLDFSRRRYHDPDTFGRGVWFGALLAFSLLCMTIDYAGEPQDITRHEEIKR